MSAFANPVFPQIDPTTNPAGSALNRISPLEYAHTKNAPTTPLESALTKLLDLKSFRFRSYKKHPGPPSHWCQDTAQATLRLGCTSEWKSQHFCFAEVGPCQRLL